jgi:hypothetical protein
LAVNLKITVNNHVIIMANKNPALNPNQPGRTAVKSKKTIPEKSFGR